MLDFIGYCLSINTKIENWPIDVSLFSVGFLSLSVVYDYGYFTYLGFSFSEAPTTISDHVRSSLVWLPTLTIAVLAIFIYESAMKRLEGGMSEEELITTSPTPKFTKWFRASPAYLIIIIAVAIPILWFAGIKPPLRAQQFSLIIFWFLFHNWVYSHPNIVSKTSLKIYLIGRWLPAIVIYIAYTGAISAENTIELHKNNYKLVLSNSTIEVNLLRTFQSYFLVWNSSKHNYEFISSALIKSYEPVDKPEQNKKSNKHIQPTPKSGAAELQC